MPLTERSRVLLYTSFMDLIADEQAVQEMLSSFPTREEDELATKELVRLETAVLRTEMAELRTELRGEMAELRTELRGEMAELRTELRTEVADVRAEMSAMELRLGNRINAMTWRILAVLMPMQVATMTLVVMALTR